jgi:ketosteroid isomerase-like protein
MKLRSLKLSALVALLVGLFSATIVKAEEWSAEQKEVWKNVEAYWALDAAGDTEGFMAYFHADYKGWDYDSPVPSSKDRTTKFVGHSHKTSKTLVYDIQPASIKVYGNVAFVHYFWTNILKDAEGKEKRHSGRWTDILTKQGNKWVLIGDHGGEPPGKS